MSGLGLSAAVGLAVIGFGAIGWAASRPHTVVELAPSKATVQRGKLPTGLVGELRGAMKLSPGASGRLEIRGRGETLKLSFSGLDEGTEQRLRNVVLLRKRELGAK